MEQVSHSQGRAGTGNGLTREMLRAKAVQATMTQPVTFITDKIYDSPVTRP